MDVRAEPPDSTSPITQWGLAADPHGWGDRLAHHLADPLRPSDHIRRLRRRHMVDEAKVVAIVPADVSCKRNADVYAQMESQQIEVPFGSGQSLDQRLADCQPCMTGSLVFTPTDLDGDGRDELALDVGPGAAIDYVEFYRVDPGGVSPLVVSEPGDPPYVEPGPAILGGGFDSGLWSPIQCRVAVDGSHELVSVYAENLTRPWRVHTTTMVLEGDRLVVTSTNEIESDNLTRASDVFQNGCS